MIRSSSSATRRYSMEPVTKIYVKGYGSLSIPRNLSNKYGKQLLDAVTKTGADVLKATSKKLVHKAAKTTVEFIGKKFANKIVRPKPVLDESPGNVEEIIIPPEKKRSNTKQIKASIIKMEHYRISELLND